MSIGPVVRLGDHVVLVGSCSWTDRTLIESGWYPKRTMSAEERLRVEFRSPMWLAEPRDRERTLALLEDNGR